MSSRAEVLARARAAREEKKNKRQKGPWGGYVLQCVQRVEQRRRVGQLASDMLPELLLLVCAHAAQPRALAARAACVCHAWCHALRGNFFTCMPLLLPHVAPGDVASMSAACRSLSHMFARARARMRAKAMQLQAKHMLDAWLDVRVGVPWDADGAGTVYSGTVIGVRSGGRCLRVKLDVGAGKARMRVHTIPVGQLFALQ